MGQGLSEQAGTGPPSEDGGAPGQRHRSVRPCASAARTVPPSCGKLYGEESQQELEEKKVPCAVAGRIMTKRRMGKLGFLHSAGPRRPDSGRRQQGAWSAKRFTSCFKAADLGDIVGDRPAIVCKTNTGELVRAGRETCEHLTKALRPLPEKFHGLQDVEERYRRRYVDLIMNEDSRQHRDAAPEDHPRCPALSGWSGS